MNSPQMLSSPSSPASPPIEVLSFPYDKDDVVATCLPPSSRTHATIASPPRMRYFLDDEGPRLRGCPPLDVGSDWYFLEVNMTLAVSGTSDWLSVSLLSDETDEDELREDGLLATVGSTRRRRERMSTAARDESQSLRAVMQRPSARGWWKVRYGWLLG